MPATLKPSVYVTKIMSTNAQENIRDLMTMVTDNLHKNGLHENKD